MLVMGLKLKGTEKGINALSCKFHLCVLLGAVFHVFRIARE